MCVCVCVCMCANVQFVSDKGFFWNRNIQSNQVFIYKCSQEKSNWLQLIEVAPSAFIDLFKAKRQAAQ